MHHILIFFFLSFSLVNAQPSS